MSHEPTRKNCPTDAELFAAKNRPGSLIDQIAAANATRDRRVRNEALEEAAAALASRMELYREKAAKRDPYASDCANLHDLANAHLEATEYAYEAIRALKDK